MRARHGLALALALGAALVATALAPAASAHFDDMNLNAATLRVGPYSAFFEPRPATPFAGAATSLVAQVAPTATGTPIRGNEVEVSVNVTGPGGMAVDRLMSPDSTGYFLTSLTFPQPGQYTAILKIREPSGAEHTNRTTLDVYPDLPYRVRPVDNALDVFTNQTTPFAFEIVNATLLTRDTRLTDLQVRLEHWDDGHTRKLSESVIEAQRTPAGAWRADAVLPASGMYHLRFASSSGGFNYDETPPLHVYASNAVGSTDGAGSSDGARTPFGGAALVLLAALGAAGVLVVLRKR